ncbi:hypothetical protein AVEN_9925-1 [Araneus ventricosus]|uniref:Uncharacterized protein n=1 Tax=Araneus ventricosus TaxID=182803 RepID=A0A4Y2N6G0_ARAVE|nr:hypothetical protein AVEN_9925-1 [Araneus ventricosus]
MNSWFLADRKPKRVRRLSLWNFKARNRQVSWASVVSVRETFCPGVSDDCFSRNEMKRKMVERKMVETLKNADNNKHLKRDRVDPDVIL